MTATLSTSLNTGINLTSGGSYSSPFTVTTAGTIVTGAAAAVSSALAGATLVNAGLLSGNTDGVKFTGGSTSGGVGSTVINTGTIEAAPSGNGAGVVLTAGGEVINSGSTAVIIGVANGVVFTSYSGQQSTLINQGSIIATATSGKAVNDLISGTVNNSGTISGGLLGIALNGGGVYNTAGGVISGGANVGIEVYVDSTITNAGLVSGGRAAIAGIATLTLNEEAGGRFAGAVYALSGSSLNLAGTIAGTLDMGGSFSGFSNISFGSAAWTLAGTAAELAGGETISGFAVGDEIDISGFTALAQSVTVGSGGLATLAGVSGSEVVDFGSLDAGATLNLASTGTGGFALSSVYETVLYGQLTHGIMLNSGRYLSPFTIAQTGAIVTNDFDGVSDFTPNAYLRNDGLINAGYGVVLDGGGGTLLNHGTIIGAENAIAQYASSTIINSGTAALISGHIDGVYGDKNSTSPAKTFISVQNSGTIIGSVSSGVYLGFGAVSNLGKSAVIEGLRYGVYMYRSGNVLNQGSIFNTKKIGDYGGGYGVDLAAGGTLTNQAGGVINGGVRSGNQSAARLTLFNSGTINNTSNRYARGVLMENGGYLANTGAGASIYGDFYGVSAQASMTIVNSGTIGGGFEAIQFAGGAGNSNRLVMEQGAVLNGSVNAFAASSNTLEFGAGTGALAGVIGESIDGFQTIAFDTQAAWTVSGVQSGFNGDTITGLTAADTLVVEDFTVTSLFESNGKLILADGGTDLTLTTGATITVTQDGAHTDISGAVVICYLRGTMIMTPGGEVPVEALRIGDAITTRFGGSRRLRWVGRQSFGRRFVARNSAKFPVHISAGALGDGLPARSLFVSPGHSMLLGEQLVLAAHLINGVTVTQHWAPEDIHYYQLDFGVHDCVLADGAWSESFADAPGLRAVFHNAGEFDALYPDAPAAEALQLCAPRPLAGPELARALAPVVARAAALSLPGALHGFIEQITPAGIISGWAWDEANPHLPVQLEVRLHGARIASVLACEPRDDLAAAGLGDGRCAFFCQLRPGLHDAAVRIHRQEDGAALAMAARRCA